MKIEIAAFVLDIRVPTTHSRFGTLTTSAKSVTDGKSANGLEMDYNPETQILTLSGPIEPDGSRTVVLTPLSNIRDMLPFRKKDAQKSATPVAPRV